MARSDYVKLLYAVLGVEMGIFRNVPFFISETKDFIMNEKIPHVDNDVLNVSDIKQELTKLLNSFKNKEVIIDYRL